MLYVDSKHRRPPGGFISFLNIFSVNLLRVYLPYAWSSNTQYIESYLLSSLNWLSLNLPNRMLCPSEHLASSPFYFQLSVWNTETAYRFFPSCSISRTSWHFRLQKARHHPPPEVLNLHSWPSSADGWQGIQPRITLARKTKPWMCAPGSLSAWDVTLTKQLSRDHVGDERRTWRKE